VEGTLPQQASRKVIKLRRRKAAEQPAPDTGGGLYFSSAKENIQFINSGCTLLDCVLGGGWPLGRIVNIVGDKSTGKTLLAMEAIANFFRQYPKGYCWYNEAESAFDVDYAKALGIPFDRVTFIQDCNTVEELFNSVREIILGEPDVPALYIMDSLDSLSDAAEMERDIEKGNYGAAKAKMLSEFFRRVTQGIAKSNVCLMIISQVRDNINASMFAEKHTRSGGKALDFYASIVLWLANVGKIKQTKNKIERVVGVHIRANCKKNKVTLPYRTCDFDITFGFGIEDEKASLAFLKEVGKPVVANMGAESLRDLVIQEWFRIEASFIPARRKYGSEES
jgi:recombination protein RecA